MKQKTPTGGLTAYNDGGLPGGEDAKVGEIIRSGGPTVNQNWRIRMMTWDEFQQQKAEVKIASYVEISSANSAKAEEAMLNAAIEQIVDSLHGTAFSNGYRFPGKHTVLYATTDPLTSHMRIGASIRAELSASPEQFAAHVGQAFWALKKESDDMRSKLDAIREALGIDYDSL